MILNYNLPHFFLILRLIFSILHDNLLYNSSILRRKVFFLDIEVNISKLHNNLLQYFLFLNDTNFCPSPLGEKGRFLRAGVRIRVIDTIEYSFSRRNT